VRQAKERLAKRLAELVSASTSDAQLPTPNPMSMPFGSYNINNPNANPDVDGIPDIRASAAADPSDAGRGGAGGGIMGVREQRRGIT
jgi:hypothetical protein